MEAQNEGPPIASTGGGAPTEENTLFAGKLIFWIPFAPLIALDLWSKAAAFAYVTKSHSGRFSTRHDVEVFDWSWVQFDLVTWLNRGTIWGLGDEFHDYLKYLRVGAIALILYFVFRTPRSQKWMLLALSLILAGALGNLYDNFFHFDPDYSHSPNCAGAVRDFIHFYNPGTWDFPAFNVADSCITVGAITLFLLIWRQGPATAGEATAKA